MVQLKRFGILQTAKVAAVIYFLGAVVFCIPFGLITMLGGIFSSQGNSMSTLFFGVFMLIAPFLYAAVSFVFVALGCWVYNLIARFIGGIEVDFG